ncbi:MULTISPECIES: hypothetical protein [unclassified Mesorhizobium]|uniref:hypothetical protein n=1 Tax=unclassified Mesorhizobium TaxID=325217 RepID=UPI0003CFDCC8|nr:hypothetical protein [Mesorhizobium sp. L2C054A000]ESZ53269.1 hypothetical protein X731_00810 [Mesorhizobium sp. L2C054A000]
MSRFIDHRDMSADQIMSCCIQAAAIVRVCGAAAWAIQEGGHVNMATSIVDALAAADELLGPVTDALEGHEGPKAGAK